MKFDKDQMILISTETVFWDEDNPDGPEIETSDEMPYTYHQLIMAYEDAEEDADEDDDYTEDELVGLAVRALIDSDGPRADWLEPSSSQFTMGMWYTTEYESDPRTGDEEATTYTPKGFSRDEQRAIYEAITGNRA